ncbi:MAG: AAA domain-containing protein [Nostoc sp.]|uniref:AAA domain-containing protein n=1 Tax=Nostoc sp. TaxID=1180 RepID=UPI002FF5FAA0
MSNDKLRNFFQNYKNKINQGYIFWVIQNNGEIIGYIKSDSFKNDSDLSNSEKLISEIVEEIAEENIYNLSATLESFNAKTRVIKLSLDPEKYREAIENSKLWIPTSGFIKNSIFGDLYQIRVQKDAIVRLTQNGGRLSILDKILFGSNEELPLESIPIINPIPLEECLNKDRINERQRLAIAIALASPDCFLLQGPPGTGKTTFISELCYQIVRHGGRVLVSSQSNLAVDNALSRLQNHPDILAVRLGDKAKEDGQEFVGDKAVKRWLRSLANNARENLIILEKKAQFLELFIIYWEDILLWVNWQKERIKLTIEYENKRTEYKIASEYAVLIKRQKLFFSHFNKELETLIQNFRDNQINSIGNCQLWQELPQFKLDKLYTSWFEGISHLNIGTIHDNPWLIASYIQQKLLDVKPGGEICIFKQNCNELLQKLELTISELQYSLAHQKSLIKLVESAHIAVENNRNLIEEIQQILGYGIKVQSSETLALSPTYINLFKKLKELNILISSSSFSFTNKININIFKYIYYFWKQKNNFNKLISSWEEAEINLSNTRINLYQQITEEILKLQRLSSIFIIGRFYSIFLRRIKEKLKMSIERISYTSCSFNTRSSILSRQIYREYAAILKKIKIEAPELLRNYETAKQQSKNEQSKFNKLLLDAEPFLNRVISAQNTITNFNSQVLLNINHSLNFENIIDASKALSKIIEITETYINQLESKIIPSFSASLKLFTAEITSLQNKCVKLYQSTVDTVNTLNQEINEINNYTVCKDNQSDIGRQHWAKLRIKKSVPSSLDTSLPDINLINSIRDEWLSSVGGETKAKMLKPEIQILQDWLNTISTDKTEITNELYSLFFKHSNVIGATCIHTGNKAKFLNNFSVFDVVIIDEVSKATPTELLVPCLLGKKIVLVGDHKQLPPIFGEEDCFLEAAENLGLNKEELREELSACLFKERYEYLDNINASRTLMLTQQYRMHSHIMSAINQFYGGKLTIGYQKQDSEREHGIEIRNWLFKKHHLIWIDLPQHDKTWHHQQAGTGRQNVKEAELIVSILTNILNTIKSNQTLSEPIEIGITSVYKAQTNLIRGLLRQKKVRFPANVKYTVGTVDEFQGMEKDIMFVSLVLNKPGVLPSEFLRTPERVNVAMSRARKLLIVTGSSHNYVELESEASLMYGQVLDIAKKYKGYFYANQLLD